MNYKQFKLARIIIAFIIAFIVATASVINNFYLAITGVLIGMLFLYLVRMKFKAVTVDERVISVAGKASRTTYAITTLLLAFLGMFLIFSGKGNGDLFSESLGIAFSYVAMFNIAVYAISFRYFNKLYGGDKE